MDTVCGNGVAIQSGHIRIYEAATTEEEELGG